MKKWIRKTFLFLIMINFFTTAAVPAFPALAAGLEPDTAPKTVRIGYYAGDPAFQDGFSDEDRKSGYAYEYYQKLALLAGWRYEYVYGSRAEIMDKLLAGEVDITAGIYQTDKRMEQMLFSRHDLGLEGEARYFAVSADQPVLAEELNHAQEKLLSSTPDFTITLWQKYYGHNSQSQALTERETKWLEEKGSLSIGYLRDNLPLSGQSEDGSPDGIAKELFSMLSSYLKIPLETVCYDNTALLEESLENGGIDAAFPVYSDLWAAESKGFYLTNALISDRIMIVYRGTYHDSLMENIALSGMDDGAGRYISAYYPDAAIVCYDSRDAAFQAVKKGEAGCVIGASSVLQRFLSGHTEYKSLNIAYLNIFEEFSIATSQSESPLAGILDKAGAQADSAAITSALTRYSSVEAPYTLFDFIQHYAIGVIVVLSTFFAVLLCLFISFRRRTARFNKEQAETRAALEDALSASNSANTAKTTFLSSMSHDIRTPLNGIIGMTAIAAAHVDDTVRVRDCLAKITASGKHLLALINEVLDMSKIESGDIHLNEEALDLCTLFDDLIAMNKPLADAKHHELTVHLLHITHEEVIGDSLRLQQTFTNLVSNAIKYTPDGGRIEITLSEKPSGSPRLACFEFIVEDNGIGMSEEYLPFVFDAFTRADNTSTSSQGTGLGMAIARNIVHMMDGDITAESILGQGSRFTITLFLKLPEAESIPYESFVNLDILVVDDDPVICESTSLLLSELGMNCEWVLSGREAVECVEKRHQSGMNYFAVLIDWKMPDMDGVSATKEIRKRVGDDVPIIIISAYDWSAIETEATQAGVNGFIGKPLFKSRLVHLFDQLLGNKTEAGASGLNELAEETDFSGKRILLAEDNELNAEIAVEILNMTGFSVEWAHDGMEALNQMNASAPGYYDCILMDIQMPVMNGLDAARAIRALAHPDAETIPIFAMTANAFADDIQAALNAGMNEHIAKPLDFDILMDTLGKYLG